jgi:hypothetical protein
MSENGARADASIVILGWRTSASAPHVQPCILSSSLHSNHIYSVGTAMAGSGVNQAVTKDGGAYNKLQRPQDYLMFTSTPPPRKHTTHVGPPAPPFSSKRKHDKADNSIQHKRAKLVQTEDGNANARSWTANKSSRRTKFGIQVELPGLDEDGSSDDGIGEALAYLREVR